jgi:hypothetical protein
MAASESTSALAGPLNPSGTAFTVTYEPLAGQASAARAARRYPGGLLR